jgi:hypothetical protein
MVLLVGLGRSRAATLIVTIACGCESYAFIGSNATAGSADDGFAESTGVGSLEDDGTSNVSVDESADTQGDDDDDGDESGADDSGIRFDLGQPDAAPGCKEPHALPSCDSQSMDPANAMGLNCGANDRPGAHVDIDFTGFDEAMTVHSGKPGISDAFLPREGDKFVVLSTGRASDFTMSPVQLKTEYPDECNTNDACPSTQFMDPLVDTPLFTLPEPIDVRPVSETGETCWEDPGLVGSGDCSNTLFSPWLKGGRAYDYAELRMTATVPEGMNGFSFDFAFFSIEYPLYAAHPQAVNDVYLTWLESERWTGNMSFDESGDPISVKSVFFDYKDAPDPGDNGCIGPCIAPQLHGFAAQDHGGTKWLTSSAPVRPGEEITVIFAMFDNMDSSFDSMAILDHFEWTCSGAPPFTTPAG